MVPPRILQATDFVNRAVRDVWIEGYFAALEGWRLQAGLEGVVLVQVLDAWNAYERYRASGDPFFRYSAWHAIQTAAAS
jgi:hypothetical protein